MKRDRERVLSRSLWSKALRETKNRLKLKPKRRSKPRVRREQDKIKRE